MYIFGQLQNAQLENKSSDYSPGVKGRTWFNTTAGVPKYDDGTNIQVFGATPSSSGTKLNWIEDANAAIPLIENQNLVYLFSQVLGQSLYSWIKVPIGYASGTQLKLRFLWYCPNNSGTVLIKTVSTLIRSGTDLMSSTTNQRTSTNTAVTLSAATVNIPQAVIADVSSSTGTINSVAISAGDLVKIQITRDSTDTCPSDASLIANAVEVTYT